jgi:hypothetical protein
MFTRDSAGSRGVVLAAIPNRVRGQVQSAGVANELELDALPHAPPRPQRSYPDAMKARIHAPLLVGPAVTNAPHFHQTFL